MKFIYLFFVLLASATTHLFSQADTTQHYEYAILVETRAPLGNSTVDLIFDHGHPANVRLENPNHPRGKWYYGIEAVRFMSLQGWRLIAPPEKQLFEHQRSVADVSSLTVYHWYIERKIP